MVGVYVLVPRPADHLSTVARATSRTAPNWSTAATRLWWEATTCRQPL